MGTAPRQRTFHPNARLLLWLCLGAAFLDGYDLVIMGVSIPSLRNDPSWMVSAEAATTIATFGLIGMTIGALMVGPLAARVGRRMTIIASVIAFSILTTAGGFAPTPEVFGLLKFLAGLGLGACLPMVILMMTEFASPARRSFANALVFVGYNTGAIMASVMGILLLDSFGWRSLFIIGGLPALVIVPLMIRYLPESPAFLRARGDWEKANDIADRYGLETKPEEVAPHDQSQAPAGSLLSKDYLRNTLLIWIASFMGLLLVYGLNTWLPSMMNSAGYGLGSSLAFLAVLNIGTMFGLFVSGRVADKFGPRTAAIFWFALSGVFLALMSIDSGFWIYLVVAIAGFFAPNAQVIVYAFVTSSHPMHLRPTALGAAAGVGRLGAISGPILGGLLVSAGLVIPWGFYGFAIVAVVGAVALACTRAKIREQVEMNGGGMLAPRKDLSIGANNNE
ncbi:MAG: aromatic acid/H+ symport family MFS transporter [Corynebacterium sp.]|uniref:MFS transporter n=1 Tax=Corynebacterium sp. TaxID=1720 RepID=UPI0026DFC431|nr:aromatic acid/H+ symport family MFS transporter [Corynebacterium sp.]MDO5670746.1 aromatic acid/H+ symport family MFS transporter [Corynebacterium sp.]